MGGSAARKRHGNLLQHAMVKGGGAMRWKKKFIVAVYLRKTGEFLYSLPFMTRGDALDYLFKIDDGSGKHKFKTNFNQGG